MTVKHYVIAFVCALVAGAAISNMKAPSKMGTMISDIKPVSHGTIHDEDGVGEVQVNDAVRNWRYIEHVTTRHPSRTGDFPNFGNN
jgi:hypothetical protein